MSQQQIIHFLSKNKGKKYTSKEISKHINVNNNSVNRALMILRKYNEICSDYVDIFFFNQHFQKSYKYWVE